jgi:hypothetical protein
VTSLKIAGLGVLYLIATFLAQFGAMFVALARFWARPVRRLFAWAELPYHS